MPDRKHPHFILRYYESVQRDVTSLAVGDHEFPNLAVDTATEKRVRGQVLDGGTDRTCSRERGLRVLGYQELECAHAVGQCARRIDYRRHGFGRAASWPRARRSTQACTSSERYT